MPDGYGSEYLHWWKTREFARFNLGASGVLPCSLSELETSLEEIEINEPRLGKYDPLHEAVAAHCRVQPECVITTSGTSMANFLAMAVLIQPGDEVLVEYPVYEPLLQLTRYLGAEIKRFPRERGIRDFVSRRTRLVVITNLHNPTCTRVEDAQLNEILELVKDGGPRVLMDEVYLECLYEKVAFTFRYGPEFVSTGSLTKAYGLGGLRCGWILAEPDLIRRTWSLKDLIDPSAAHAAQRLSVVAFRKLDRLATRAKHLLERNRALLREIMPSLDKLEISIPEYGTCVFPRLKKGDPGRFFELLHDRYDTDVVPGSFFEKPDHFRLGLGVDSAVFAEGLNRLRSALDEF